MLLNVSKTVNNLYTLYTFLWKKKKKLLYLFLSLVIAINIAEASVIKFGRPAHEIREIRVRNSAEVIFFVINKLCTAYDNIKLLIYIYIYVYIYI